MDVVLWPHHLLNIEAMPMVTQGGIVEEIGPHNPIHLLHPFLHPPQMMDTTWHVSANTLLPHQRHVAELSSHCCQSL